MLETKETEKIVIAKPVACRPIAFSKLKPFSTVLSGAVDASPPAPLPETAAPVIRPRTGRFEPTCNINSVGAEASNVVYKPIAKLVSKTTIAFLANLGGYGISPARAITNVGPVQPSNQAHCQYELTPNTHRDFPVQTGKNVDNTAVENSENYNKLLANNGYHRASYDGQTWRKYGQKLVKGSDFPRSYYKCTHTNCPVKKKVEKTLDGQIAEIVYEGEHNHPNPQPQPQPLDYNNDAATRNEVKTCNQPENENNIESSGQSNFSFSVPPINDHFVAASSNSSLPLSGDCEEVSESLEVDFRSKKRKHENQLSKESVVERGSSEPRIVVEKNNDSGTTGDGFRWRKYGQKVVKGKIYPRSYYRCTSPKCNVRKYVERMSEDPTNFISTYEGKHNHSSAASAETSKNARTKEQKWMTNKR